MRVAARFRVKQVKRFIDDGWVTDSGARQGLSRASLKPAR
jgi:hypothetical protein